MASREELLQAADLADRAAARLEKGWCQKAVARDDKGIARDASDPNAIQWCAYGAVCAEERLNNPEGWKNTELVKRFFEMPLGVFAIGVWNDMEGRTQAEVVQAMRDTATELRKRAEAIITEQCQGA